MCVYTHISPFPYHSRVGRVERRLTSLTFLPEGGRAWPSRSNEVAPPLLYGGAARKSVQLEQIIEKSVSPCDRVATIGESNARYYHYVLLRTREMHDFANGNWWTAERETEREQQ